jgi:hypothetical protein
MKFDYTYIPVFGYPVFEPMVIVTNFILLFLSLFFFNKLKVYTTAYAKHMSLFMVYLGVSTLFGAAGHAIHLQMGETVFKCIVFLMNFFSMFSMYHCFCGSYVLFRRTDQTPGNLFFLAVPLIVVFLGLSVWWNNFLLIKILAGLTVAFALLAHARDARKRQARGSLFVFYGFVISILSIIAHSMHISLHEWFNHKDLSHVIMILSLIVIFRGVFMNCRLTEMIRSAP